MRDPGTFRRHRLRLHWRIYLAVLSSVGALALLAAAAWHLGPGGQEGGGLENAAEIAAEALPSASAGADGLQASLERWRGRTRTSFSIYSSDRGLLASAGEPLPPPPAWQRASGLFHTTFARPALALKLPDGRWLVAQRTRQGGLALGFLWLLFLSALVVAAAAYPVSRRLTRRLGRLEESVDALGAGDLAVRVPVEGGDEVARLARSFNRAAERIEALVGAQKRLLANASHEFRSPLARMKVAASLLEGDAKLKGEITRDVAELDELVEEVLLASRLESGTAAEGHEAVDLTAVVAEECARVDASFSGSLVTVTGSSRLLRRMVRNLVENARRHGGGEVEVTLRRNEGGIATLDVLDRGPGVPADARERVFEPFFRILVSSASPASGVDGGGTGLGLALARQVARRHGGDVACLPRDGGGSCFRVTLP